MDINIINNLNNTNDEFIIIGVSAGPDSMALLHMILTNTNKKIVCAHINHNKRKNSIEEEKYLKNYCKSNNIIFECHKITSYTENNFENEARKKRYEFYEEILNKYNSHILLLAHHGDDLIETVLMKIIRGSNLEGYAGIKTYSQQKNYTIIRPLLSLTKQDIIKYNQENNIKYYTDESNNDINYTRNRYRKEILPLLKKEDTTVHLKFLKYSNTLQEYYNYIEKIVIKKIKNKYKNNIINITSFKKEEPFIQKNIIFYILSNLYNNEGNIIKDKNINDILKLTKSNKVNAYINLPKNYIAKKQYNEIIIEKRSKKNEKYKIPLKNINEIDNIIIKKITSEDTDGNNICRLNSKEIKLPLYLRNKKNGDYIYVLGLNGKKKVKEIFIEEKIPKDKRENYPLLVDADDNILWIPNIKKSKYNVKKNEIYDIILTSYKGEKKKNEKENTK